MSRHHRGWAAYVPIAERRRKAARAIEKLRKQGHTFAPVNIQGRAIATTFWGKAWCANLASYRDYESRLPRGRTYVRNGSVIDLQIGPLEITARVSGSAIYTVTVSIGAVSKRQWQSICSDCAGGIDLLVELLQGRLSKAVMERICRQATGLFPKPSAIRFSCSCPDHASMCKHVAAVFYGVGARLDERPELLFRLRDVDATDLLTNIDQGLPIANMGSMVGKVLKSDDLSAMFGLDMAETATAGKAGDAAQVAPKQATSRPGPSNTDPKASGLQGGSAVAKMSRSGASSKRVVLKKPASRKPAEAASQNGAAASDAAGQTLCAMASGRPAGGPAKQIVPDDGTSATSARKPASARKAREPQPVKWWLPSNRAKAYKG